MDQHTTSQHTTRPGGGIAQGAEHRSASSDADRAKEHVGDEAREVAAQARERMAQVGEHARQRTEEVANAWRQRAADEARTLGRAMESATSTLEDEGEPQRVCGYTRGIARGCGNVADYLEHHDLDTIGQDVGDLARRNPAMFVGGLAVLGFAAGRVLSSSPPKQGGDRQRGDSKSAGSTDQQRDTKRAGTPAYGGAAWGKESGATGGPASDQPRRDAEGGQGRWGQAPEPAFAQSRPVSTPAAPGSTRSGVSPTGINQQADPKTKEAPHGNAS